MIVEDDRTEYSVEEGSSGVSEPSENVIFRHEQLDGYQLSFETAKRIFSLTMTLPAEERYSLTDQIRKSSRSVSANIAEGWRKRRYKAAFQSSLNVAEAEAAETQTWLRFAMDCGYASSDEVSELNSMYDAVIGKLVVMINSPERWLLRGRK